MRLDARRRACLSAIGIELWRLDGQHVGTGAASRPEGARASDGTETANQPGVAGRVAVSTAIGSGPSAVAQPMAREPGIASLDWEQLQSAVADCMACALHQTRTQTVFGVGDPHARLMIIGEAPGADEDRQGEPFVGRAGQLLNAMLAAIGFQRDQVYIANIVKCRPPGNRDPHMEEAAACQPYLHRQIELIQPRLILSVGRVSAQNLLGTEESVGRLRGRVHRFDPAGIPLIVTYHPAYLLRRPQEKAKAWQDLQAAARVLVGP